jgi:predicted phage terminase large subunit-like protein
VNDVTRRELDAMLRTDLVAFTEQAMVATLAPATVLMRNWHHQAMGHRLHLCAERKIRRLIITMPPRSLKSVFTSVAFPAWLLGHQPSAKIVCVSYSADLAGAHARGTRDIMESPWYRRIFATRIHRKRSAEHDFLTTKGGGRFATSPLGGLTGRGGGYIIIDDPIKADEAHSENTREALSRWFGETVITRLDDKRNDVIILVMQRLHVDDLAGRLLDTGEWVHLSLPAIAQQDERIPIGMNQIHVRRAGDLLHPEREGQAELDHLLAQQGKRAFSAQYLQSPVAPDGTIILWSWFKQFDALPEPQPGDQIVQSWDTASKGGITNAWSVCTTWLARRDKTSYLLDVHRARHSYPELRRAVIALAAKWNVRYILIEDASSGQALLDEFKRSRPSEATWYVEPITPVNDKVQRAEAAGEAIYDGRVFIPRTAAWLEALRNEIRDFPGRYNDQVDSMTQFINWLESRIEYATDIRVIWPY